MVAASETEMAPIPPQSLGQSQPDLSGAMDGEIIPKNKFEEFQMMLGPLKARLESSEKLKQFRPLREFAAVSVPTKETWQVRLQTNVPYFQVNYLATFSVMLFVSILISPTTLFFMILMAIGWFFFLHKNEDENWQVIVGGVQLGKTQRTMVMGVATVILGLFLLGQLIFSLVGSVGVFCVGHALCNHSQEGPEQLEIDPLDEKI